MHRILFVEEGPAVGGSTHTLLHALGKLDRSLFDPCVLFRYDSPAREAFAALGVETATWTTIGAAEAPAYPPPLPARLPRFKLTAPYRMLRSAKLYATEQRRDASILSRWIRSRGFSLVHANNAVPFNIGAIVAARRCGLPAVSHQRGFFRLTPLHRFLARRVERFVCVSDALRLHCLSQGLAPNMVVTIHDGIDLEKYRPRKRASSEEVLVGWFARFERWKGCLTFAEAARTVLAADRRFRFIMAGAGPEEEKVRRMVESDPVFGDRFSLPGFRRDAAEIMSRCDVVVNSSIEPEPLSNTALEALALAIPAVVSDVGGNPEIVAHGVNGFVFEHNNSSSLAAALVTLGADRALRERFGEAGRLRAERLFDARRYADDLAALYTEILEGCGRP